MAQTTNRKINIWINGSQVENTVKSITTSMKKLQAQQSKMTIGSKEYIAATEKIKTLNSQLVKHKQTLGTVATAWSKIKTEIAAFASGQIIANMFMLIPQKVIQGLKDMTTAVMDFEKGITGTLSMLSEADITQFSDELKEGVKSISKYGLEIDDVNTALFDTVSAGVEAGDAIAYLDSAARLAIGGQSDLATATDGLTTVMSAFGLASTEVNNVADAFYSAQKYGKTTVEELSTEIGKAAPIANMLGISYQELLSASAQMTLGGISTAETMTGLKSLMSALIKPTDSAQKVLTQLGIPFGAVQVKAVGFTEVIKAVNEAIATNPGLIAEAIPQIEALTTASALSGASFTNFQTILSQVNTDIGESSSLSKAYAMTQETMAAQMAVAKAEAKTLMIELGEKLQPVITSIITLFSGFTKKLMGTVTWFTENINIIKTVATTLGALTVILKAHAIQTSIATALDKAFTAGKVLLKNITSLFTKEVVTQNLVQKQFIIQTKALTVQQNLQKAQLIQNALATNTLTVATKGAKVAQEELNTASKTNWFSLILTGITLAVAALITFKNKLKEANKAINDFNTELANEKLELNNVFEALKKTNPGTQERADLIAQINTEYAEYLPKQLTETSNLYDISYAQEAANKALEKNIALRYEQTAIEEASSDYINKRTAFTSEILQQVTKDNANLYAQASIDLNKYIDAAISKGSDATELMNAFLKKYYTNFSETDKYFFDYVTSPFIASTSQLIDAYETKEEQILRIKGIFSGFTSEQLEKDYIYEKTLLDKSLADKVANAKSWLDSGAISNEEFLAYKLKAEKEYLEAFKALNEKYKTESITETTADTSGFVGLTGDTVTEAEARITEYLKIYEDYQKQLAEMGREIAKQSMTDHEKSVYDEKLKWNEIIKNIQTSIDEMVAMGATSPLTDEELELLDNFYVALQDAENSKNQALLNLEEDYQAELTATKEEAYKAHTEALLSEQEKEINEVTNYYQELITKAEEYGWDTTELYAKMMEEIAAINDKYKGEALIFGMSSEEFDSLQEKLNGYIEIAGKLKDAWGQYSDFRAAKENEHLAMMNASYDQQQKSLDRMLAAGTISQNTYYSKVDNMERGKENAQREAAYRQAKREKAGNLFSAAINTASAIIQALPNIPLSIFVGAMGALETALIAAEPIPQFAKGGRVTSPTVGLIGEQGPEVIFSNKMLTDQSTGPIIEQLARIQEGKMPALRTPAMANFEALRNISSQGSGSRGTVSNVLKTDKLEAKLENTNKEMSEMKTSINEMLKIWKDPKTRIKANISMDEFKRIESDNEFITDFSKI